MTKSQPTSKKPRAPKSAPSAKAPKKGKKAAKKAAAEPVRRTYRAHVSAEPPAAPSPDKPKKVETPRPALQEALFRLAPSYDKQSKALAERGIQKTGGYLSLLVRGKRNPSVDFAKKLAAVLGVPLETVVGK